MSGTFFISLFRCLFVNLLKDKTKQNTPISFAAVVKPFCKLGFKNCQMN